MRRALGLTLRVLAGALFVSMLASALHDVSKAWDVWYYHLPFAARLAGLVDVASYTQSPLNEERFQGFPLFAEALQGLAWRVTGRPEAANLVAFAALPGLALFLRRERGVPLHLTFLALVAVPLVQIHASAAYVDLFANACAAVVVLGAWQVVVSGRPPSVRRLVVLGLVAAAAANSKFQIVPVVLAAAAVLLVSAARAGDLPEDRRARRMRLLVVALAVPVVLATPIKNAALHGNPVWPVELRVAGVALPSREGAYASSPRWLEHVPRPVRFAASALELGARPVASGRRWSIDQWTPPDDPGYRMGGFFGAYVVVNVLALAWAALRRRTREARLAAAFATGLTLVVSLLPQSHELRYYMVWMLVLVGLNLAVWAREAEHVVGLVATAALAVVAWSTEATYLWPSGDRVETFVAAKVDRAVLAAARPGERLCLSREPWTFLYAPRFHPGATWTVQEAAAPEDCPKAQAGSDGSPPP